MEFIQSIPEGLKNNRNKENGNGRNQGFELNTMKSTDVQWIYMDDRLRKSGWDARCVDRAYEILHPNLAVGVGMGAWWW